MKSIMEEASSVAKAIENGWAKAGKPKEFSIKIFEQPQRNFFGITTKNAKIAIIFDEKHTASEKEIPVKKPKLKKQPQKNLQPEARRAKATEKNLSPNNHVEELAVWDPEMVTFAKNWLRSMLDNIDKKSLNFKTEINNSQLMVNFEGLIVDHSERNKRFMRHLAQLLVQTMRNKLKKPLRGYKIIMKSE